jgi:hypothetical protein
MEAGMSCGQENQMSRDEAIERYILLRLRTEEIKRLGFLVEGLHAKIIQLPKGSAYTHDDLKDAVRTAYFGWLATLTDKDERALYAFDPLFILFPGQQDQIAVVKQKCEACHAVLQQFRNTVAFHSRAKFAAHINARRALREKDTFLALRSARRNFEQLMNDLIGEELIAIPELQLKLSEFCVSHHPAFANVVSATLAASSHPDRAFYNCEILGEE